MFAERSSLERRVTQSQSKRQTPAGCNSLTDAPPYAYKPSPCSQTRAVIPIANKSQDDEKGGIIRRISPERMKN